MSELGTHLMLRLRDSRVIASSIPRIRKAVVGIFKVCRPFRLLAFRIADTHIHVLVAEPRTVALEVARRIEISLQHRLRPGVGFSPAHPRRVADQWHLSNAFWYVLRQEPHHGTDLDPLFEGSNLPDLLGMRQRGAWTIRQVRDLLPRVRRAELEALLPVVGDGPVDWALLADAAAAAGCVLGLTGRNVDRLAARIAAVHAGAELSAPALSRRLGIGTRSVERLRRWDPLPGAVDATLSQLRLRTAVAALKRARTPRAG